jgi:uncharacterized protein
MYPTAEEKAVIQAAEKLMVETMAKFDPSHDAYHGEGCLTLSVAINASLTNSTRRVHT